MRGIAARQHHAVLAGRIWRAIAFGAPPFRYMNATARVVAASSAAGLVVGRFTLVAAARDVLGADRWSAVEGRISVWLRARDPSHGVVANASPIG